MIAALPMALLAQRGPGGAGGSANRVDFLAGYLGLSDAQKSQATATFAAAQASAEQLSGQATSAREALDAAVKASASDAQIDQLSAAVGAIQGQQTAVQSKAQVKFRTILTAEQKLKLDERSGRRVGPGAANMRSRPTRTGTL